MFIINDVAGNAVQITSEEHAMIMQMHEDIKKVEESYYPEDGSQDHIDHHIYDEIRAIASEVELELEEKYNTIFNLV